MVSDEVYVLMFQSVLLSAHLSFEAANEKMAGYSAAAQSDMKVQMVRVEK
jgi:hypothetical protein